MSQSKLLTLVLIALAIGAVAGCGSDGDSSDSGGDSTETASNAPSRGFNLGENIAMQCERDFGGALYTVGKSYYCVFETDQALAKAAGGFFCKYFGTCKVDAAEYRQRKQANEDLKKQQEEEIERKFQEYVELCKKAGGEPVGISNGCVKNNRQIDPYAP